LLAREEMRTWQVLKYLVPVKKSLIWNFIKFEHFDNSKISNFKILKI